MAYGGSTIGGLDSSKITDVGSLDYCTFRIPYEELNVMFRHAQKDVDRAASAVAKAAALLTQKTSGSSEPIPQEALRKNLDFLIKQVRDAKKTFESVCARQLAQTRKMKARCDQLLAETGVTLDTDIRDVERLERQRFGRIVVWHLLRCGFIESARSVTEEMGLGEFVDVDVFEKIYAVEKALRAHDTAPCLAWIDEHRSKLRRTGSRLEIVVRQQDVVELIEAGNIPEAVAHVKKYIAPIAKQKHAEDLRKTMGAIACTLKEAESRNPELHAVNRWEKCAEFFITESYRLYEIHGETELMTLVKCGLASLKTPACAPDHHTPLDKQKCIVCRPDVWPIAENLPYSHISNSRILCSMTDEICDDDENTPFLFPSGHVFGKKAIEKLKRPDGKIYDPVRKVTMEESDALRLYFL